MDAYSLSANSPSPPHSLPPPPRENAAETALPEAQYIAVPIFDLKGKVCAFIAMDNVRMPGEGEAEAEAGGRFSPRDEPDPPPDLTEPWRISLLQVIYLRHSRQHPRCHPSRGFLRLSMLGSNPEQSPESPISISRANPKP